MSNHYHVILHINTARAKSWTDYEVVERWHQLFNGTILSQKYLKNEGQLSKAEGLIFQETIDKWRLRLQASFFNKEQLVYACFLLDLPYI